MDQASTRPWTKAILDAQQMPSKIIVVGDVLGHYKEVFAKVSALHAKNAFSFALIVGNLFHNLEEESEHDVTNVNSLINNQIEITVPTYFTLGKLPLPEPVVKRLEDSDGELCDNLHFLGKRNTLKTSDGVRIVSLGGSFDPDLSNTGSKDKYLPFYSLGDAKTLKGANTADILITSDWPINIRKGSKVDFTGSESEPHLAQECVAELCATLKPRYYFSSSQSAFYEREPFFFAPQNQGEDGTAQETGYAITRFISLAPFGNASKQKWIYAFNLDSSPATQVTVPPGTTPSPLHFLNKKRGLPSQKESFSRFSQTEHNTTSSRPFKKSRHKAPPPGPSECFFCLSNPNVATHLVTSISDNAYVTIAKGPLTTSQSFKHLDFPCHILIIPVPHAATLNSISNMEDRHNTFQEMKKFQVGLHRMLQEKCGSDLGAVTWEVSRAGGVHTHWQLLPIAADLIRRGLVDGAFRVEAENEKYPPFRIKQRSEDDTEQDDGDYFKVSIWRPSDEGATGDDATSGIVKILTLPLDSSFRFDLQFGRRVIAKLLNLETRLNWRDCAQTETEETADAEAFKKAFESFDFSLQD